MPARSRRRSRRRESRSAPSPSSSTMPESSRRSARCTRPSRGMGAKRSASTWSARPRRPTPCCRACSRPGAARSSTSRPARRTRPLPGWSAYCAAKAGLAMLTRTLAAEYAEKGIRVFGFAPGVVDTEMQAAIRASGIGPVAKLPRENADAARASRRRRSPFWRRRPATASPARSSTSATPTSAPRPASRRSPRRGGDGDAARGTRLRSSPAARAASAGRPRSRSPAKARAS